MNLEETLDSVAESVPAGVSALAYERGVNVLREFVLEYCGLESAHELSANDLREFLNDWAPREGLTGEDVAPGVVAAVRALAAAVDASLVEELRGELIGAEAALSRAGLAQRALRQEVAEQQSPDLPAGVSESGEELMLQLTHASARWLADVDYDRAESDFFRVQRVAGGLAHMRPRMAELAGVDADYPVRTAAAEHLRAGDIVQMEIAPQGEEWRVLNFRKLQPNLAEAESESG